jgi:hypothetical protein
VKIPLKLRQILGRARIAFNYAVGRQVMAIGVKSYDDDVWIVSYPKSGNTWTRFLIANLIAGGQAVGWSNIERLVPDIYLGRDSHYRTLPRPRYFKSHEAYRPEYRRVIFIVRDPRDVAVSHYHFVRKANMVPVEATIDDIMEPYIAGNFGPYGSWGENVGSWLGARRGTPDFLVVRYEDLLADTEGQLARIAESIKLPVQNGDLRRAVENSRADRMREMEQAQRKEHKFLKSSRPEIPFVRAAKSGQWQSELPPEAARQIESTWHDLMRELGYV